MRHARRDGAIPPLALPLDTGRVKGFLAPEEGERLYALAYEAAALGPLLEIGSYCGKSTVYLGLGAKARGGVLFAVDHHRGSEEHQPGEGFHDPALVDPETGQMDSLPAFRRTLRAAALEDTVIPVLASSRLAARAWGTPLALVFIDGGHSFEAAFTDYELWAPLLVAGGILAIHDLFEDPSEGGQAPITIYRRALASGDFEALETVRTLGALRRR